MSPFDHPRYQRLSEVFADSIHQASAGKGKERHDPMDRDFQDQEIVQSSMLLGSNHGNIFQACKKARESARLPTYPRQRAELLGAINYLAAAVIVLDDLHAIAQDKDTK